MPLASGFALFCCATIPRTPNDRLVDGLHEMARMVGGVERDPFLAATLAAERTLPREWFVPRPIRTVAYLRQPLPIGAGQTISDPWIVAVMTAAARVRRGANVLEIGTGSGYQAAVLARLGARVATIEIVPGLAAAAAVALRRHGFRRVASGIGDGFAGWPSRAPFDAIVVTAGAREVPRALLDQLAPGGSLVMPVGDRPEEEQILVFRRVGARHAICSLGPATFVPLTGGDGAPSGERPDEIQPFCFGRAVT